MKRHIPELLAGLLVLVAIAAGIRQQFFADSSSFCLNQVFTHETVIAGSIVGAVGLIAGKYLSRNIE